MDSTRKQQKRRRKRLQRILDAILNHVDFQTCHLSGSEALSVIQEAVEELQDWGNGIAADLEDIERN